MLWLLLILLLAAAGGAYYWWASNHDKPQYVTAEVTQGDIERSVNVTGSINPRVTVQVGSYVSGTIKSLTCDFNTEVKAGQICAKIDPSTFQVVVDQNAAQLNSSRAQLRKDQAAEIYANAVYQRDTKLLKDGIVAQEIVDNDQNVFKQAVAQIDLDKAAIVAQEASLKSAVVNLGYTNIVSPVTGTVLTRSVDVGQTVASSLQTPTLFLIGKDLTKMQVDANVSEADVGRIKVDQDVTFSVQAYPDKTFEGTVKQIRRGPITVQNVVTYDVVVTVDNPDLLLFPGMTADAEIVTDARENVLRIPLAAVRFTPERSGHGGGSPHEHGARSRNQDDSQADNGAGNTNQAAKPATQLADKSAAQQNAASGKEHDGSADDSRGQHRGDNHGGGHGDHHGWERGEHHGAGGQGDAQHDRGNDKAEQKPNGKQQAETDTDKDTDKPDAQTRKRARVWVLRDGTPHPVWITTGLDDGDAIEVLSGKLKPGDQVIVKEIRQVETKSAPIKSPFNQQAGAGRRGMGRP